MPTYLITGATGQQGRATIDALLARGAKVHAVVRDPMKAASLELVALGATLFKGDNDDFDVFRKAAQGCAGIFLNVMERPQNPEPEKQVEGILVACKDAGLQHVVVSTSSWAGNREKWDIPETKTGSIFAFNEGEELIEDAVRRSGLQYYTILRPSWFHSNYLVPAIDSFYPELRESGTLVHSYDPGATFPHINVEDIGKFAAMALSDPARFNGQEIELSSENLGIEAVAEAIGKITGKQPTIRRATAEEPGKPSHITQWQIWANSVDLRVDTESLKRQFEFRFTTLEEYLVQEKEQRGLEYF
ncbi:NmrA family protein [Xylaria bambusicola]|uniref:NmrA family protein n=1 Tax=Xylaria bambusicola TaxID=326684 RepID=UPI0020084B95|nr:NmrA family protein [Xylaria bambusicola]KAI0509242.1 NmrA family protein [Xylaria bambusicola]